MAGAAVRRVRRLQLGAPCPPRVRGRAGRARVPGGEGDAARVPRSSAGRGARSDAPGAPVSTSARAASARTGRSRCWSAGGAGCRAISRSSSPRTWRRRGGCGRRPSATGAGRTPQPRPPRPRRGGGGEQRTRAATGDSPEPREKPRSGRRRKLTRFLRGIAWNRGFMAHGEGERRGQCRRVFNTTHRAGSKHGGMGGVCEHCPDDVRTRGQEFPGAEALALRTLRLTTLAKNAGWGFAAA